MLGKLLVEFRGEVFDKIQVYTCVVRFLKGTWMMEIPRRQIGCLSKGNVCRDQECSYYIHSRDYDNCVLNIDRALTFEEIANIQGVSRQRIDQYEKAGRRKFKRRLLATTHVKTLRDFLPDAPIIIRNKKREK